MRSLMARSLRRLEEAPLQGTHRRLLHGLRVVPAADVEDAVGHEEAELVGGAPAEVAASNFTLAMFDHWSIASVKIVSWAAVQLPGTNQYLRVTAVPGMPLAAHE